MDALLILLLFSGLLGVILERCRIVTHNYNVENLKSDGTSKLDKKLKEELDYKEKLYESLYKEVLKVGLILLIAFILRIVVNIFI